MSQQQQQQQQFIQLSNELGLCYPQLADLFQVGNNTIIISWNRDYQEINSASIQFRYFETLAGLSALTAWLRYLLMLGWFSNRMETSVDDGKARGKD